MKFIFIIFIISLVNVVGWCSGGAGIGRAENGEARSLSLVVSVDESQVCLMSE